jgi:hypothetical protein
MAKAAQPKKLIGVVSHQTAGSWRNGAAAKMAESWLIGWPAGDCGGGWPAFRWRRRIGGYRKRRLSQLFESWPCGVRGCQRKK